MRTRRPDRYVRQVDVIATAAAVLLVVGSAGLCSVFVASCTGLNLDRRSWEATHSVPIDCFGEASHGKVFEALGVDGEPATPPFDLSGTWAQRQHTAAITAAPLLGESINSSLNTLRMEIVQDGFRLTMTAEVCAIDQWTTSSAGRSVIPQSFIDAIGLTERTVTLEPSESGYRYREDRYVRIMGMMLEDALNESIPTDESDPRVVDSDGDGHPGITVGIEGIVDGEVYIVQRHWEELCGDVLSDDRIEGYIRWNAEQEVLAASSFVLAHTPDTSTHPDWERNRFELRRIDPAMTCAHILEQAETIFAD